MQKHMVKEIKADVIRTRSYIGKSELDDKVMRVIGNIERDKFISKKLRAVAYENHPLSIGFGQTISQPYIVALMTDMIQLQPDSVVLEIGTGSGYQAAVLASLAKQVYSMEIIEALADQARSRLRELGYKNIEIRSGDGYHGWSEHAPFDAIIVTAVSEQIPPPLVDQLKPGGKLIIPVGHRNQTQQLVILEKDLNGITSTRQILPVSFVPLTGDHSRKQE